MPGEGSALAGIVPMLVTPFDDAGNVCHDDLGRLVTHVLGFGVDGVAVRGSAGGAQHLEEAQRFAVVETVAAALPVATRGLRGPRGPRSHAELKRYAAACLPLQAEIQIGKTL